MAGHSRDGTLTGSLGSGKASSGVAFELGYHESPLRAFAAVAGSEGEASLGEASLREFADLVDAVAWARRRLLADPGLRIGVNLCELPPDDEERRRRGIAFAAELRDQAEEGGLCVSAVSFERLTSRLTAGPVAPGRGTAGALRHGPAMDAAAGLLRGLDGAGELEGHRDRHPRQLSVLAELALRIARLRTGIQHTASAGISRHNRCRSRPRRRRER